MIAPAGTMIPEEVVPINMCGTSATGWMNGAHPTTLGDEVERQVCYNWNSNSCNWYNNINVTNCGAYYTYKLVSPSYCDLRYCAVTPSKFIIQITKFQKSDHHNRP